MIDKKKIKRVQKLIAKDFPDFRNIEPKVIEKKIAPQSAIYKKLSLGVPKHTRRIFKLRFRKRIETVDQIKMEKILTVTLDEKGDIIKITESK